MRFVPYPDSDSQWQLSTTPVPCEDVSSSDEDGYDYKNDCGDQDFGTIGAYGSSSSVALGDNNSLTSEEELNTLPDFLSLHGLEDRFKLTCQLRDVVTNHTIHNDHRQSRDTYSSNGATSGVSEFHNSNELKNKPTDVATFFVNQFSLQRQQRRDTLERLLKIEEERLKREEEERRKKLEEERRRKEEAERKAKEEAERKARDAAERKRLEEERQRKLLEEERKRKEQAEKEARERQAKLEADKKQKELELQKQMEEQAKKKESEIRKQMEEESNKIIKPKEIEQQYQKYMKDIADIESQIVEPVKGNLELKKIVGAHRRKINPKFGQLTNSQQQLTRLTNEINDLIQQTRGNELAFKWILNFVAEAIISQAETEVSVKPKSSLPLAKLTLNLLILYKDLKYFVLARFYKSCSFLLGYSCSSDTEEGRIRLGWNRDEDTGKWESDIQYNERLAGISTLYSVITRLRLDNTYIGYDPQSTLHPLPISNSWSFLARMADAPATELTETHYTIVGSWWDACASDFLQAYGKQSIKLLLLIANQWTAAANGKACASMVRLKLLGEEWTMNGKIKSFPPMER